MKVCQSYRNMTRVSIVDFIVKMPLICRVYEKPWLPKKSRHINFSIILRTFLELFFFSRCPRRFRDLINPSKGILRKVTVFLRLLWSPPSSWHPCPFVYIHAISFFPKNWKIGLPVTEFYASKNFHLLCLLLYFI